jgi:hypothetical protein
VDWTSCFRTGSTAGSSAQSNKASASIKYVGMLDQLSDSHFLEKKSSPWSSVMLSNG